MRVIFMPRKVPSRCMPVEYYVETNSYEIAEHRARTQLNKDKKDCGCYDQVVLAPINVLEVYDDDS